MDGLDESLAPAARQEAARGITVARRCGSPRRRHARGRYRLVRQAGDRPTLGQAHRGSVGEPAEDDQGREVGAGPRGMEMVGAIEHRSRGARRGPPARLGPPAGARHRCPPPRPCTRPPPRPSLRRPGARPCTRRAAARRPDPLGEPAGPLQQMGLARGKRRGALLQHHGVPAAPVDRVEGLTVVPVVLQAVVRLRHRGHPHPVQLGGPTEPIDQRGKVLGIGQAVADEEDRQALAQVGRSGRRAAAQEPRRRRGSSPRRRRSSRPKRHSPLPSARSSR